jgi:hypothetical protein
MGFLDELKDKAEEFWEKAKEGFDAAKDKASDLIGDVKDRFDKDEDGGTGTDKVEEAVNYDPGAVGAATKAGIGEAAAGAGSTSEATTAPTTDPVYEPPAAPETLTTSESAGASNTVGEADAFGAPASDPLVEPELSPSAESSEPPTTPDEAYDAVLEDAAKTEEYRSDSAP